MENNFRESDYVNLPEVERINALNQSGKIIEKFSYSKPLTEKDIKKRNVKIVQAISRINELEEDKKELAALIKEEKEIIKINHKEVIDKFISVTERVWEVIDTSANLIETINSNGSVIAEERIKSGTQLNMFKQADTGTND